jgi:hypothetical protein
MRLVNRPDISFTGCVTRFFALAAKCLDTFRRLFRQSGAALLQGILDVFRHHDVPGYCQLPWLTRCRVNVQALLALLCSRRFVRVMLWLAAWLLGSYVLVWTHDLGGPAAAIPPLLALVWVLPWMARARRAEIARLLGYRWPG